MSGSCCTEPERTSTASECPACGHEGKRVEWLTVASLLTAVVPAKQQFCVCADTDCAVVHFGEQGAVFRNDDLNVQPGFKTSGLDALVCYCFLHRRGDIEQDLQSTGTTNIADEIRAEIRAGNCACEVRNPTGRCCLGSVNSEIKTAKERLAVSTAYER